METQGVLAEVMGMLTAADWPGLDSDLLYQAMMDSQGRGGGIWAEMWFALVSSWGSKAGGVGGWDEGGMFRWNIDLGTGILPCLLY